MTPPFNPSIVLITGATSGIGKALAHKLVGSVKELILTGRNTEVMKEFEKYSNVSFYSLDLRIPEDRKQLLTIIEDRIPDLLINSAGVGLYGSAVSQDIQSQSEIIEVNCIAITEATIACCKVLKKNKKQGVICNISSALAYIETPYMSVYAASKAYVNSFSIAIDDEMKSYGIRVLTSCPGQVATQFKIRAAQGVIKEGGNHLLVMQPEYVAEKILKQISKGKRIQIVNFKTAILIFIAKLLPKSWLFSVMKSEIEKRK